MLTGHIVRSEEEPRGEAAPFMQRLVARLGEPVVRAAMGQAMRILGTQFVMGRSIDEALGRARDETGRPWRYSFDMLGEAALTWPMRIATTMTTCTPSRPSQWRTRARLPPTRPAFR